MDWSTAKHDTVPSVELWLNPAEGHVYLASFLLAENSLFKPPYAAVRDAIGQTLGTLKARQKRAKAPSAEISDQRLRTWRAVFESLGFLRIDNQDTVRLTQLGRQVSRLTKELEESIEGANDHIAKLGVNVLSRHLLRNPIDGGGYPEDCDLRPYRFIWRAMRELDNKIHWEEMNRVLMKVNYERETQAAIEKIKNVRSEIPGRYIDANVQLLGDPVVSEGDETKRRITPWFTKAGFGGLLISSEDDSRGFRNLISQYVHLIDDALEEMIDVVDSALISREGYLSYLTSVAVLEADQLDESEEKLVDRMTEEARRYGSNKIVCFSGIPATGKTRIAKIVAARLTESDPYRYAEIQFHETVTYDDFVEGFVPKSSGEGFELKPKVFRKINRKARLDHSKQTFVLLIEELTRANIHGVLGELITYIEHRDRPFTLTYSQEEEIISANLIVLATMNPRDRSAVVLDDAIQRRIHRINVGPSSEALRAMLNQSLDAEMLDTLSTWYDKYIDVLPFAHGVFAGAKSGKDLKEIWNGTIRYFISGLDGDIREQFKEAAQNYPWH